ncbi:MAG: polymer-forming cytoskeletal protein [Lachnospiraceae bacterium]|nr:polymer-forming cytoskeletal protein [Lachnospiraceae bacterium]
MGFFGDLKQDLSQAVNELLPNDNKAQEAAAEDKEVTAPEENTDTSVLAEPAAEDSSISAEAETEASGVAEKEEGETMSEDEYEKLLNEALGSDIPLDETAPAAEPAAGGDLTEAENALDSVFADMEAAAVTESPEPVSEPEPVYEEVKEDFNKGAERKMDSNVNYADETSVITLGMTVNGDISAEGSLEILGSVKGNIDVTGKLNVTGHVNGNSKAHEIFAENAKITGDVCSESSIKIGTGTVVVGNITGFSAAIAGAVKGDIDVHGPVILDSSAIVMGNIRSKSVQINNGAAIEGNCSQCYADVSPTSFFDDYKPEVIGKKEKSEKSGKNDK